MFTDLTQKIDASLQVFSKKRFLHTSPHHDDTMLAYFPVVQHLVFNTQSIHHFAVMTSGFNSVSNEYLIKCLNGLEELIRELPDLTFNNKDYEVKLFFSGIAKDDQKIQELATAIRMARDILQVYGAQENILKYINQVKLELTSGPSDKINALKGRIRDWEEEIAWGHLGVSCSDISHMKLGFYSNKDKNYDLSQDIEKVVEILERIDPDVITVASEQIIGHATHIKVFNVVSQAVKIYMQKNPAKNLTIWEYRNVWCQFDQKDVNLFFPVTLNDFYAAKAVFHNAYKSQVKAMFPTENFNGPFCDAMQQIMRAQYEKVKMIIGSNYFDIHENNRIKATHGLCFINSIDANEFLNKYNFKK